MELTTEDIVNLYALAREARIKARQSMQVGALFQKIEAIIGRGQADPFIAHALTEERAKKEKKPG